MKINTSRLSVLLFLAILLSACGSKEEDLGPAPVSDSYEQELQQWIDERIETLKEPTGWLRLAGMHILEEGENRFGSGSDQDIQFPDRTIAEHAGIFDLQNGQVTMEAADGVEITTDGEAVQQMTIYDGEDTPEIEHGSLVWHVIERQDLIAIRLYNKENEKADQFEGFDRFPADTEWHLKARFDENPEGTTISVTNVLGQTDEVSNPGALTFKKDGEYYTIEALDSASGRLFLIVGDETNRTETYQAGRFMYVDYPDESGHTIIDFNKIYNPPCAYNLYTTCQLPPASNRLDLEITAGELRPVDWEGL
ncbi:DUF1684 domain-containing protein [Rhodohalobacter sp. SW132]|uniref:DUF1684 domain-containing protein n=1 Tax=Rhodohalobacter sp. SW132 TaxID=2293433 RepID=UPI000E23FE6C|nr:DUF1684 domain-containing protein [Rhodohalobacter sp. SW132]REL39181.1 DUF1684 domain-containing protein [Rhodohalobacter sp. SW132]